MKIIVIGGIVVALVSGIIFFTTQTPTAPEPVACTLEAKICPDGTTVGRVAPTCEFAACPASDLPFQAFTATFSIATNGTVRVFTDKKYHNQDDNVFITSVNPQFIQVKAPNITWADFFKTLPMKLSSDCLTTGTGQNFCTNATQKLTFYINGVETNSALSELIKPNNMLRVEYK